MQQPTVVYIQQRPVVGAYGYTYGERARWVYWGNPYVRVLTITFIAMVIIGIVLAASAPLKCRNGCTRQTCVSVSLDTYPCDCGLTCENYQSSPQAAAGDALISIGVVGLVIQSIIACGCCGNCWTSCQPPATAQQPVVAVHQPAMMQQPVYTAQPQYNTTAGTVAH